VAQVFVTADKLERDGRFIDTRFDMQNPELGLQTYVQSHIEGAIYWDLDKNLSDMTKKEGRHPLPDKYQLQQLFEQAGLQNNDAIYIYDQGASPFATRAWWMLKYAGFEHAYIVNGGYDALVAAGFNTSTEIPHYIPTKLDIKWNDSILVTRSEVLDIVEGNHQATLLDARANGRYKGEFEPLDPIAGHIPTAKNYDWEQLKDQSGFVITSSLLEKVSKEDEIVVYCGSGVTATPVYSVLVEAGYKNIKIYMGGYSDWIQHHTIETGENL
jgi:thiosulfate/3-mercaptopyruvate sulfurtransferase